MLIVTLLGTIYSFNSKSKFQHLFEQSVEPEEQSAYRKMVTKHQVNGVICAICFAGLLLMLIAVSTKSE